MRNVKWVVMLTLVALLGQLAIGGQVNPGESDVVTSVPRTMTYQGILKDGTGEVVSNSSIDITFRIFNAEGGGTELWSDLETVSTDTNGIFTTELTGLDIPFDEDYWLEMEIDAETLIPRQKINMSAYAATADTSDYAHLAGYAQSSGSVDGASGGTINGSVHTTGTLSAGNSITIDGVNDRITATGGTIDFDNENLITTGKMTIGANHTNTGGGAFVAGNNNTASGHQNVALGYTNDAGGLYSTITGGNGNTISDNFASIGGGYENTVDGEIGHIGGGQNNTVTSESGAICGGRSNIAGFGSFIGGGVSDSALGGHSVIGGGGWNQTDGIYSTVGGGRWNYAQGDYSVIAGGGAQSSDVVNIALGEHTFIGGGSYHEANGGYSTIGGGSYNIADGIMSSISGGSSNHASGNYSCVGGGGYNYARGLGSVICGGGVYASDSNSVSGDWSVIGGGRRNLADGDGSTIGGGNNHITSNIYCTVGGGSLNTANGEFSTVGGGNNNIASNVKATIAGGHNNVAGGQFSTVSGGNRAEAIGDYSTVCGGADNTAGGSYSIVAGGNFNEANGGYSFTAGRRAKSNHNGTFVWADHTDADFASTGDDQFLIRAEGGVGIGTDDPDFMLTVGEGTIDQVHPDHDMVVTDANQARLGVYVNNKGISLDVWDTTTALIYAFEYGVGPDDLSINPHGGDVGIGTITPDEKLHIAGNIKIVDGTEGNGKVLTSDASGVGSWQTLPVMVNSDEVERLEDRINQMLSIIESQNEKISRLEQIIIDLGANR
ncbi:MAG: hypothetical protein GY839_00030 [candidate division Zixibacteria bacterium]|nr:hypothetical protein [candidate division Zixibacteria bacterium]